MDYGERRYWDRKHEADAYRRQEERERDMQWPRELRAELWREENMAKQDRYFEEATKREARGCYCPTVFASSDFESDHIDPQIGCPVHNDAAQVAAATSKRLNEERQRQREQAAQRRQMRRAVIVSVSISTVLIVGIISPVGAVVMLACAFWIALIWWFFRSS